MSKKSTSIDQTIQRGEQVLEERPYGKRLESAQYEKIRYTLNSDFNHIRSEKILFDILYRAWEADCDSASLDGYTVKEIMGLLEERFEEIVGLALTAIGKMSTQLVAKIMKNYSSEYEKSETTKLRIKRTKFEKRLNGLSDHDKKQKREIYIQNEPKIVVPTDTEGLVRVHFGRMVPTQSTISKAFKELCEKPIRCGSRTFVVCKENGKYTFIEHTDESIETISDTKREALEKKLAFCSVELKKQKPMVLATYNNYPSIIGYDLGTRTVVIRKKSDANTEERERVTKAHRAKTVLMNHVGGGIFLVTEKNGKIVVFLNTEHESFQINAKLLSNLFQEGNCADEYLGF